MTDVLPVAPAVAPVAPAVAQARTVLICDEEPLVRHVLTRLLVERSAKVTAAVSDGFAAADAYTHQPAGVVLIGIHRGTGSGFEALDLLLGLHRELDAAGDAVPRQVRGENTPRPNGSGADVSLSVGW